MDLGDSFNAAADWAARTPIVAGAFGNAFIAALLLAATAAVIGMYCVKISYTKKEAFKAIFYIYVAALVILFLHFFITKHSLTVTADVIGGRQLVSQIRHGGASEFDVVPRNVFSMPPQPPQQYGVAPPQQYVAPPQGMGAADALGEVPSLEFTQ